MISFVLATTDAECEAQSNTNCTSCLNVKGCSYCKDNKKCFPRPTIPTNAPCDVSNLQMETCFG